MPWSNMPEVGSSTLRVALWKIYSARLYTDDGSYRHDEPFALSLTYQQAFSAKALIAETKKQLTKQDLAQGKIVDTWANELKAIWPDVSQNDSLTLYVDEHQQAQFYLNQNYLGAIADPKFAKAFSGIWLSEKSSRPRMRKKLIGE